MLNNTLSVKETYRSVVMRLPQVVSGVVTERQAEAWLTKLCSIIPANHISGAISQQSGIGADEMRALIAHNRSEYYPSLSANEILNNKWLEMDSLKQKAPNTAQNLFLHVARAMISDKYGMSRNRELENELATPCIGSWKIGRPAMILSGDREMIVDIQIEDTASDLKNEDTIRLHHYDLTAQERGMQNTELLLVKVKVQQSFMDAVCALTATSASIKSSLARHAHELRDVDPGLFSIKTHHVTKDQGMYSTILNAGTSAWENVQSRTSFTMAAEPKLNLSSGQRKSYRNASQAYCAAETIARVASVASDNAKNNLLNTAKKIGITGNHKPEYAGAFIRTYDEFDTVGAAEHLVSEHSIDKSALCEHSYDTAAMANELKSLGVDPVKYLKFGAFNKERVLDASDQLNLSMDNYKSRTFRATMSRKTRGPDFDALQYASSTLIKPVKKMQDSLVEAMSVNTTNPNHAELKNTTSGGFSPK